MNAPYHRLLKLLPLLFAFVFYQAYAQSYSVEVQNNWGDESIELVIAQFRSEHSDKTAPKVIEEKLVVRQIRVSLKAHERRTISFDDTSGGYWLAWRLIEPIPEPNRLYILDLLKGERTISAYLGPKRGL
jgi:hypothetical protein